MAALDTAFLPDDLSRPGYDEHRREHRLMRRTTETIEGYKQDGAKKVIALLLAGAALVFVLGVREWVKGGG